MLVSHKGSVSHAACLGRCLGMDLAVSKPDGHVRVNQETEAANRVKPGF